MREGGWEGEKGGGKKEREKEGVCERRRVGGRTRERERTRER